MADSISPVTILSIESGATESPVEELLRGTCIEPLSPIRYPKGVSMTLLGSHARHAADGSQHWHDECGDRDVQRLGEPQDGHEQQDGQTLVGGNVVGKHRVHNVVIGVIATDSIFTPIKNVKYTIENYRVEQKTDYEKLVFEIKTNGSIRSRPGRARARG